LRKFTVHRSLFTDKQMMAVNRRSKQATDFNGQKTVNG